MQSPSSPQVDEADQGHSALGSEPLFAGPQAPEPLQAWQSAHSHSGSVLPAWLVQVPREPEMLQARQEPVQVLLQQTPSAQLPLVHSLPAPQASPLSFFAAHRLEPLQ